MFRIHHPAASPIDARDNHPGMTTPTCPVRSPIIQGTPFLCTRGDGHRGDHRAAVRLNHVPTVRTIAPSTPDAVGIVAEWDNDRTTDGLIPRDPDHVADAVDKLDRLDVNGTPALVESLAAGIVLDQAPVAVAAAYRRLVDRAPWWATS